MKIFIFSVLLSLCLQFCSASTCSCCETELAKLRANAEPLIQKLFGAVKGTHKIVGKTLGSCSKLFEQEEAFLGGKFGANLKDARCKLNSFTNGFQKTASDFSNSFNSFDADSCASLDSCKEFRRNNNLTCRNKLFEKGCEAELNRLRCEMSDFLRDFEKLAANSKGYVKKMNSALGGLTQLVGNFKMSAGDECGCQNEERELCELNTAANQLFINVNRIHWEGHLEMINLQYGYSCALKLLSTMSIKLGCAKK